MDDLLVYFPASVLHLFFSVFFFFFRTSCDSSGSFSRSEVTWLLLERAMPVSLLLSVYICTSATAKRDIFSSCDVKWTNLT